MNWFSISCLTKSEHLHFYLCVSSDNFIACGLFFALILSSLQCYPLEECIDMPYARRQLLLYFRVWNYRMFIHKATSRMFIFA
jgi:hypothetical protein